MNIPFPVIYPPLLGPAWLNSDKSYDEDAELTLMEEENKKWLDTVSKNFMKRIPVIKLPPAKITTTEPPAETGSDDDDVFVVSTNDESTSLDESQDMDADDPPELDENEVIIISDSNTEDGSDTTESITEMALIAIDVAPISQTVPPEEQSEME